MFFQVFAALDPDESEQGFLAWVGSIAELTADEMVAIHGKAIAPMVSACAEVQPQPARPAQGQPPP